MPPEWIVALSSSPVLVAVLANLREGRKARRKNETEHQVMAAKVDGLTTKVGELADAVDEVKDDVHAIREEHGARVATLEGRFGDHLELERIRRR